MGLIIALDDKGQAAGELFWDDGDSRGIVKEMCECVCVCNRGSFVSLTHYRHL